MKTQDDGSGLARTDMAGRGWLRGSGAAAAVGGLILMVSGIMQAMQPNGCIAEECAGQIYRSPGAVEASFMVAGLLLIAAATFVLLAIHPKGDRRARVVRIGAFVAGPAMILGVLLLSAGQYFIGIYLVLIAMAAYAVTGVGLAVAKVLPPWSGVMLTVAALLLFLLNDQNERILFLLPFGLTWMVLGALLWTSAAAGQEGRSSRVRLA